MSAMTKLITASAIALCAGVAACATGESAKPLSSTKPTSQSDQFGVIVMAHGGPPEWNAAVEQTVAPLGAKVPIEVAFGMADATSLQDAVRKLEARDVRRIGVVRLFVSGESWLERTEQIFGLRDGAPAAAPPDHHGHGHGHGHGQAHGGHSMAFFRVAATARFELSREGLADAAGMGPVLADRVKALSKAPAQEDVLILAHGPGDDAENARWLAKLDERAQAIRGSGPFRRVQVETLREDWPEKRVEAEARIRAFVARAKQEGGTAIVIPFRVQGFGPYAKVLEGLSYVSDGTGLIPHREVGAWIAAQIDELAARPFDGKP